MANSELVRVIDKEGLDAYSSAVRSIVNDAVDEFIHARHAGVPRTLYHYTLADVPASIARTSELWGSHYEDMNDAEEVVHLEKRAREFHADALARSGPRDDLVHFDTEDEAMENALWAAFNLGRRETPVAPYVISLSTLDDDIQQWIAYADSARGVCVRVDMEQVLPLLTSGVRRGVGGSTVQILPVVYDDEEKRQLHEIIIQRCLHCLRVGYLANQSEARRAGLLAAIQTALWYYGSMCKHRGFRSEAEWRIVVQGPPTLPGAHAGACGINFALLGGKRRMMFGMNRAAFEGCQPGQLCDGAALVQSYAAGSQLPTLPRSTIPYRGQRPAPASHLGPAVVNGTPPERLPVEELAGVPLAAEDGRLAPEGGGTLSTAQR